MGLEARTDTASLERISQMAVEFHDVRNFVEREWRTTAVSALTKLMSTHVCTHVHGNNWGPFTVVGGFAVPNSFEASFARRSDHVFTPSTEVFPTELDRPCNPKTPDFYLGAGDY